MFRMHRTGALFFILDQVLQRLHSGARRARGNTGTGPIPITVRDRPSMNFGGDHSAPGHGEVSPRCVPVLPAVARYRPDAFPKGPRTGKAPVRGNISPACIQIQLVLARYARHASEKPRRAPLGNAPREHLAAKGRFRRPKPPDHARRTNLATL